MRHAFGKPSLVVAAIAPRPVVTDYEKKLSLMSSVDLLQEYETVIEAYTESIVQQKRRGQTPRAGANCEYVRLARREMARRLFRSPGNAA